MSNKYVKSINNIGSKKLVNINNKEVSILSHLLKNNEKYYFKNKYIPNEPTEPGIYDGEKNLLLSLTKEMVEYNYNIDKSIARENGIDSDECVYVILPEGITKIGNAAFARCLNLKSINIPEGVQTIGSRAFWADADLSGIVLPQTLVTLQELAFSGCYNITELILPESLRTIARYALQGLILLSRLDVPSAVDTIGEDAFKNIPHVYYTGSATGSPWGANAIN